jgi:hypothetical protein
MGEGRRRGVTGFVKLAMPDEPDEEACGKPGPVAGVEEVPKGLAMGDGIIWSRDAAGWRVSSISLSSANRSADIVNTFSSMNE